MNTPYLGQCIFSGEENSEEGTQAELSEELFKQVTSLLQLVRSSSTKSSEAYALFMDELSAVVSRGQLHSKVEVFEIFTHLELDTVKPV